MLYFLLGLAFGIGVRIFIDYVIKADDINNIKEFLNIIIDKLKSKPKATVTSYGYNSKSNVLNLKYSDGTIERFYRDFVTWRTIPEMTEVSFDKSNFIDTFKVRLEFESNDGLNI